MIAQHHDAAMPLERCVKTRHAWIVDDDVALRIAADGQFLLATKRNRAGLGLQHQASPRCVGGAAHRGIEMGGGARFPTQVINRHRARSAAQAHLLETSTRFADRVAKRLVHGFGDNDLAGPRDRGEARGDIHRVAEHVAAFADQCAGMRADTQLEHRVDLYRLQCLTRCIGTGEHQQQFVTVAFDTPSTTFDCAGTGECQRLFDSRLRRFVANAAIQPDAVDDIDESHDRGGRSTGLVCSLFRHPTAFRGPTIPQSTPFGNIRRNSQRQLQKVLRITFSDPRRTLRARRWRVDPLRRSACRAPARCSDRGGVPRVNARPRSDPAVR